MNAPLAKVLDLTLRADPTRTVLKPFELADRLDAAGDRSGRLHRLVSIVAALDEEAVARELEPIATRLRGRHRGFEATLRRNAVEASRTVASIREFTGARLDLLGTYVTQEYSFEAAALFNPSAMIHPDQGPAGEEGLRVALSLRGIGEGHVSSVTLRSMIWRGDDRLVVEVASPLAVSPTVEVRDRGARLTCSDSRAESETVLFPVLPTQSRGLEDLRSVRFVEDDGRIRYLGTFTAVGEGGATLHLMEGFDFRTFDIWPARGASAGDKGAALFPRRLAGEYAMVARTDDRSLSLVFSDDLLSWRQGPRVLEGDRPWEAALIGNCGSPLELDQGWLLLTHGVGPMRGYCIGACLLDRADPSKVLARLASPLLAPDDVGRDGYVPNIVYSCGSVVRGDQLLLPFGVADTYTGFAVVELRRLLSAMS